MPEGRMLRKKISRDEEVAKLSNFSIILYTWSIPFLDVEGKILADSHILKGIVVPHLKQFTLKRIRKCVEELGKSPLVIVYGNGHKYMKFKGFNKNQKINKEREAPSEIPDPTPDQLQSNSRVTPAEVKLSKVNISKDQQNQASPEYFKEPTKEQKEELTKIHILLSEQRFNIYTFIARVRKSKGYFPPVETMIKIGYQVLKSKPANLWGYFTEALKKELPRAFADLNIKEAEELKNMPVKIGDLLK